MSTKSVKTSTFGVDINIELPDSVEALNAAAGRDVALEWSLTYFIAHLHLGAVRKAVVKALADATGEERKSHEKDGKKIYDESEGDFVSRIEATLDEEEFQSIVRDAAATVVPDFTRKTRSVGISKAPAKKYITMVASLVEAGKFDAFCEKVGLEGMDPDDDDCVLEVASKIRDIVLEKEREAKRQAIQSLV